MTVIRRATALAVLTTGLSAGALVAATVSPLAAAPQSAAPASSAAAPASGQGGESRDREATFLDARRLSPKATVAAKRQQTRSMAARGARADLRKVGPGMIVDLDDLTGTPRFLGRTDGFLSGRRGGTARSTALAYVRGNLATLGLSAQDLGTLSFRKDYVDSLGVHHLSWVQRVQGYPVYGNGLKVAVTRDGRVLSVQGSPVPGLSRAAAGVRPGQLISSSAAIKAAARDLGGRAVGSRNSSSRVWFLTAKGLRPGWSTYVETSAGKAAQHVLDAESGRVLFRRSTQDSANGDAYVYDYYPGAPRGGSPKVVNFVKRGWLKKRASFLKGDSVVAWSDVNDDDEISPGEKTPRPGTKKGAQFKLKPFKVKSSKLCSRKFVCTWDPEKPGSWRKNRKADVTNAFYLASNFHDWLERGPAKFTQQAGNFSTADGDPVLLNALDGADSADGLPDGDHVDNANMNTPPDGTPPTMQMYLFRVPGTTDEEDPSLPASSSFDASVLYHEYTHGLSNRLVVDPSGNSTLNSIQAGAMGEAWSDFYALDYLTGKGFIRDRAKQGDVQAARYLVGGKGLFRNQAIDCATNAKTKPCTKADGKRGGYTYEDFPRIGAGPEVHDSGEVWAQTLWDMRRAFGQAQTLKLVTRAMSLSAADPSMLDMRNAILQANLVANGGKKADKIWSIFAKRGMGFYAGAIDAGDAFPEEDFHKRPPAWTPRQAIAGTVTDDASGDPVEGALVLVAGQGDQYSSVTDANGEYFIPDLYKGTYQKVAVLAPGYFPTSSAAPTNTVTDFAIVRDYAAESGGAEVIDFDGPDYSPQCGPSGAIDLSLTTGWGSTTGDDNGTPTNVFVPKSITIDMGQVVDIDTIAVDPSATCGDGGSASVGDYRIETSVDDTTYVTSNEGTFTADDRGQLNELTPSAGGTARYLRFTMLSNQTPDFATNCPGGNYSGCSFTDLTEIAVFGTAAPS